MRLKRLVLVRDANGFEMLYVDGNRCDSCDGELVTGLDLCRESGADASQLTRLDLPYSIEDWPEQYQGHWTAEI